MSTYWKVVHLQWPEVLKHLPIDNGYAVASIISQRPFGLYGLTTNLVVVRYSGYELRHHALVHCNNLNIWGIDTEDRKLWPLLLVNREFLYDAV